jgi:micrococcal nuclease
LGVLVIVAAAGCSGAIAERPPSAAPSEQAWRVTSVVDGDTLVISDGHERTETVRLIGINTPEEGECWAAEAKHAMVDQVGGGPVWLERDVSDRDRYGRLLRYVSDASRRDVGGLLIDDGHAIARAYPPDTSRDGDYRVRQRIAQEAGRGAWASDACGPTPSGGVDGSAIRVDIHPDAVGDDSRNLNDEWVRFTNVGQRPLDLGGWMVRDESSSHRYRFEGLVLRPGTDVTLRSGCGTDTDTQRYWCVTGSAVWNNGGDTVFLLDPSGNIVTFLGYPTLGMPASPMATATNPP